MELIKNCRNPVLPVDIHIPDPEAHVMPNGRVYVYGSWDKFDDDTYCSKEYMVVSSDNMVDWCIHDKSFDSSKIDWIFDKDKIKYPKVGWEKPSLFLAEQRKIDAIKKKSDNIKEDHSNLSLDLLYAPDGIFKDGKYYLYFCCQDDSEGVAISDKPEGPFVNPVRLPCGGIDPAVFVDTDDSAYFFWGQLRASGVKLQDNMLSFFEETRVNNVLTEEEHGFHEGISIRKRKDIYYLVYSCINRGKPTSLAYATSKSPLGPYKYQGIIIDNDGCDPSTWNNHGSIEEVNGQWYVFYHRSSRNKKNRRRLCIEPIYFNDEGLIKEVVMTSQGAGAPFSLGDKY